MVDIKLVVTSVVEDPEGGRWMHTMDSLPGKLWKGLPFKALEYTDTTKIEVGEVVTLRFLEEDTS